MSAAPSTTPPTAPPATRALTRKLVRDVRAQRGPLGAVALVAACGVALFVTLSSMRGFLSRSLDDYYRANRFADVFVHLKRAPASVAAEAARLPGVAVAAPRIVTEAVLDVPGLAEPAVGRFVSLPPAGALALNVPHLRAGRWPSPVRRDEVIASEAFAQANALAPGDSLGAVLAGRWASLRVVGVAISPEYVYELQGGELFPDNRRFGVLWMPESALADATGMRGAFNDLTLRLIPGASEPDVIRALDRALAPYGTLGAYGRSQHVSHRFISDEIQQNRVGSLFLPVIFLGVTAFLLNVVLSRLVSTQRAQIAVLKAFGYSNGAVGRHYLAMALLPVAAGAAAGVPLGAWMAARLAAIYARFYRFPTSAIAADWGVAGEAVAIGLGAAALGALAAVGAAVRLPPAEGMRPPLPPPFHRSLLDRLGLVRLLSPAGRMIVRNIARRPLRAAAAVVGIALAFGIVAVTRFTFTAIDRIKEIQFHTVQREDVSVAFRDPVPRSALYALRRLPGVLAAEPLRLIPVEVRNARRGEYARRTVLVAVPANAELRRIVDAGGRIHAVPRDGVLLTAALADALHVVRGDTLAVELREGARPIVRLAVVDVADELLGTTVYTDLDVAARFSRERETISGALLVVDPRREHELYARLKALPALSGVAIRTATIQGFEGTIAQSFRLSLSTAIVFACVLAFGIVYNGARVSLSERGRELASLRVLGFTLREVTAMFFGEQAVLAALGMLVGVGVGVALSALIVRWASSELFRIPLVVSAGPYAFALGVLAGAALLSGAMVRRRVRRLDMVESLKTGE